MTKERQKFYLIFEVRPEPNGMPMSRGRIAREIESCVRHRGGGYVVTDVERRVDEVDGRLYLVFEVAKKELATASHDQIARKIELNARSGHHNCLGYTIMGMEVKRVNWIEKWREINARGRDEAP